MGQQSPNACEEGRILDVQCAQMCYDPLELNIHSLKAMFEYMMMLGEHLVQGEIAMDYKELLPFSNITSVSLAHLLHPQPNFPMSPWVSHM